jgi:hypothetical protein
MVSNAGASAEAGAGENEAGASNGGETGATGGKGGSTSGGGKGGSTSGGGKGGTTSGGGKGGTGGSSGSGTVTPPFASFQKAAVVIGQRDFVSNDKPSTIGAAVTDYTFGSAAFDGQRLFFSDTYTQRVLGFASLPTQNGKAATLVFGQASMSTADAGTTLASLYQPQTLHADGTTLAIADAGNHRVLLTPVSTASSAAASVVVGWPDEATPSSGCSGALLRSPASAFVAGGKLFVADRANNRVLIWKKLPKTNGAAADLVLGQSSMTSCVANDSLGNGTMGVRSAATLNGPTDVWSDGTSVIVADRGNNRVLVWSSLPSASGTNADLVIGQTSFAQARDGATATGLYHPSAVAYDGTSLFVADSGHHRVLGWTTLPTDNGTAADMVLGQHDFTHGAANDDAQTGTDGTAPTARTLALPSGVAYAGDALVVSDTLNRRVLIFQKN